MKMRSLLLTQKGLAFKKRLSLPIWTSLILGVLTQSLSACPICMGAQDSPTASAVNNAIFIMFGVLGLIFTGIGSLFFSLYRRAKNSGNESQEFPGMANGLKEACHHA